jgi:hypothetical protein
MEDPQSWLVNIHFDVDVVVLHSFYHRAFCVEIIN